MPQDYFGAIVVLFEKLLFPGPLGPGFAVHFSILSIVNRQQDGSLSSEYSLVPRRYRGNLFIFYKLFERYYTFYRCVHNSGT